MEDEPPIDPKVSRYAMATLMVASGGLASLLDRYESILKRMPAPDGGMNTTWTEEITTLGMIIGIAHIMEQTAKVHVERIKTLEALGHIENVDAFLEHARKVAEDFITSRLKKADLY